MNKRCLILVVLYNLSIKLIHAQCEIDPIGITVTTSELPFILRPRSKDLVYPTTVEDRKIHLDENEEVDVACPGGQIVLDEKPTGQNVLPAQCASGDEFVIGDERYRWEQISCNKRPESTARYTGDICGDKYDKKEIEIGYAISRDRFVRLMLICFDDEPQSTLNSYFDLIPTINQGAKGVKRPSWIQFERNFFRLPDIDLLYKRLHQRETINGLLGLPADDKTYIQDDNHFLSRGHLTAKTDMFYAASQDSTFRFVNALPQWQTVNGANWNEVEKNVRDYAEQQCVYLRVWSGGYGVTTLPHADTQEKIPLYLYASENERLLPVPDVFWKVVYDNVTEHGVALISSNNPYKTKDEVNFFCVDISSSLSWLHWNKDDQKKGISWACTIQTFRETVKSFPVFPVTGILE